MNVNDLTHLTSNRHDANNNHSLGGIQSCSAMFPPCVDASAGSVASASVASEMLKDGADGAEQSGWRLLQLSACDILEVPKRIKCIKRRSSKLDEAVEHGFPWIPIVSLWSTISVQRNQQLPYNKSQDQDGSTGSKRAIYKAGVSFVPRKSWRWKSLPRSLRAAQLS